jgi:uncharacterized protein (DUF1501 family)
MATTRRQFIKRGAGALSAGLLMPQILFARRKAAADGNRRILVVVQLNGGNDGLNTVIPYTEARYAALRPMIGFKEHELKDGQGKSTILNSEFALHPSLGELKQFYDERKLAVILGVGYPDPDYSHAISMQRWQVGSADSKKKSGWLGRYADSVLLGKDELAGVVVGSSFAQTVFRGERRSAPLINKLGEGAFTIFSPSERGIFTETIRAINKREFAQGSFLEAITQALRSADKGSESVQGAVARYRSSVAYPETNPAAIALKTVAVLAAGLPDSYIFHVAFPGFFDTHARQIGTSADNYSNRLLGVHATEMRRLSEAIKLFYDDMKEHQLNENCLLMTYSEFGRRPYENASMGTDHGTASNLFVVGDAVKGGDLYGMQPSLAASDLSAEGDMRFTTDFRSVYATVLDRWLAEIESARILGANFPHMGFL